VDLRLARESDHAAADALVAAAGLPLDDLAMCRAHQYVLVHDNTVVATAALEVRNGDAILRSVAVAPGHRGQRLGEQIVAYAIDEGRQLGLGSLYLLTETAADFFPRFGFVRHDRAAAPAAILASAEYDFVCGSDAVAMVLDLAGDSE
jgi:N-acetylglutamate synthase-like GNAT family acetyltransferase